MSFPPEIWVVREKIANFAWIRGGTVAEADFPALPGRAHYNLPEGVEPQAEGTRERTSGREKGGNKNARR